MYKRNCFANIPKSPVVKRFALLELFPVIQFKLRVWPFWFKMEGLASTLHRVFNVILNMHAKEKIMSEGECYRRYTYLSLRMCI